MAIEYDALGEALAKFEVRSLQQTEELGVPYCVRVTIENMERFLLNGQRPPKVKDASAILELGYQAATGVDDLAAKTLRPVIAWLSPRIVYQCGNEFNFLFEAMDEQRLYNRSLLQKGGEVVAALSSAMTVANDTPFTDRMTLPEASFLAYSFPSRDLAANYVVWRETVARHRVLDDLARKICGADALNGKSSVERMQMLVDKGFDKKSWSGSLLRGSFFGRHKVKGELSGDDLAAIPAAHRPKGEVMFTTIGRRPDMPPAALIENLPAVLFDSAVPVTAERPFAAAMTPGL